MSLTAFARHHQLAGQDPAGAQPPMAGQPPPAAPTGHMGPGPQTTGHMGQGGQMPGFMPPAPWQPYMPGQFGPGPSVVQPLFQTQPGFNPQANQYPWPGTPWGQQSRPQQLVRELQRISRERAGRGSGQRPAPQGRSPAPAAPAPPGQPAGGLPFHTTEQRAAWPQDERPWAGRAPGLGPGPGVDPRILRLF